MQRYYNDIGLEQAVGTQFRTTKQGPFTNSPGVTHGMQMLSLAELQSLNATGLIESNRTNQAHLEYLFYPTFYPNQPTPEYAPMTNESYISLSVGIVCAQSLGNISLQSNSHSDGPSISLKVSSFFFLIRWSILRSLHTDPVADPTCSVFREPRRLELAGLRFQESTKDFEYASDTTVHPRSKRW